MAKTVEEQPPTDDEVAGYIRHAMDCTAQDRTAGTVEITHADTPRGEVVVARCTRCGGQFPPEHGLAGPENNFDTAAHYRRSVERERYDAEQRAKGGK